MINAYKILVGNSVGKIPLEGRRRKLKNIILVDIREKLCGGVEWIYDRI